MPPNLLNPVFAVPVAFASPLTWPPDADDEATAWGVLAGYRIIRYAAVELAYLNLGQLERTSTLFTFAPVPGGSDIRHELETTGPAASALGILPLGAHWELFVRAGVFFADMESTISIGGRRVRSASPRSRSFWAAASSSTGAITGPRASTIRTSTASATTTAPGEADIDLLSLAILYRL